MFLIDLDLNNVIGLYLFFINHKELSVDWITLLVSVILQTDIFLMVFSI